ncbi:hypothetical protein RDI58_021115 [Solanum bulbocastanum]|uniref:Uncharacterized protein n=1 Tax=Solanum bulbocastanum TaxID=147425 RepID=A0AAN8T7L4_SOLBU
MKQIEDARELICRLEREVADIEQDEKCLKDDEIKYKAAHRIAQAKVEILVQKSLRMFEENSDLDIKPGITIPLAKIVPKRFSSRKRAPSNFYVPTHFRPSPRLHGQGFRRGRGRPPKQSSNAPAVSPPPASPSGSTRDSPLQTSVTTSTPEAVAPIPLGSTSDWCTPKAVAPSPLESTRYRPLEVLSGEEETKSNINPSRILKHPPKTNYTLQHILDENSKKVIVKVESLLVQNLLTSGNDVDYMIHQANSTFKYLKGLGGTDEGPRTTVIQETNVSPSIQEEGQTTNCRVISTVGSTAESFPNELFLSFRVDITIEKAPFQAEVRMSAEKNDKPVPSPPVIPSPLAPISPTNSICDPIIMDVHQLRVGDWTSPGRRRGSRKRDSPDFFVPTPFGPSLRLHGQGLRRGPGRPPKQRLDESSASQPLWRGPGRPRRKRSDAPTNAPEEVLPPPVPPTGSNQNIPEQVSISTNSELVPPPPVPATGSNENIPEQVLMSTNSELVPPPPVPPTGSNKNIPEQVSMSTKSELVPPPPVPPTGSNENIPEQVSMSTKSELVPPPPVPPTGSNENILEQVSMSTNSELVPPPPVPPLGSISDTFLLIPCDEEEDQRETNLKVNPFSRLETPKQTPSQNQMPEK